jgi:hypothetical protein
MIGLCRVGMDEISLSLKDGNEASVRLLNDLDWLLGMLDDGSPPSV